MAVELKKLIFGIIIVLAVFSGIIIKWQFDKDYITLYRDGTIIAKEKWVVEAERTSFLLDSWYDKNIKCPKVIELGGYVSSTGKSCMYPDNYYEQLSRSLINTKIDFINSSDYFTVFKNTPFYKYGTRGAYAGFVIESFTFNNEVESEEEFPGEYIVNWDPKDTRNYRLIWRVENLKGVNLNDGNYTNCQYKFGYVKIDLKEKCNKLERAEVKGNRIWFYFKPERDIQEFDLGLVDPPSAENINITILHPINSTTYTTSSIDLNWAINETPDWCAYSLDGGENDTSICETLIENFLDLTEGVILIANQGFLAQSFNTTKNTSLDILSIFVYKPANRINSTITLRSGGLILAEGFLNKTIDPNRWINISLNQSVNIIAGTRYWINATGAFTNYWLWMRVDSDYENGTSESESGVGADDLSIKLYSNKTIATNITLTSLSEGSHNVTIYASDTSGNMGQSDYVYWTKIILNITLLLDGLNGSRKYEYGTMVNLNANCSITSPYGCTVCINLTAPYHGGDISCGINSTSFLYNITTLRQDEFSNGSKSISISSSDILNVTIDNRTEMRATNLNITSSGISSNINITYYGKTEKFRGDLLTEYLIQDDFIHSGEFKKAVNLTYLTEGSNYIYSNISLNLNNLSFEVSGPGLDVENEFNYPEHFNHSVKINNTLSYHVDTLGYLDDFTANNTKWNLEDGSGTGTLAISSGYLQADVTYPSDKYLRYTDLAGDLRNSSRVEIIQYAEFWGPSGDVPGGSGMYSFEAFDGTNKVNLYYDSLYIHKSGGTAPRGVKNFTLIKNSEDYKSWKLYINGSLAGTHDLGDLNFDNQIELQFYLNPGNTIRDTIILYDVRWSGIFLNRSTNNGTYKSSGNFTSKVLNVTKTNISRVLVSWAEYEPDGTKITGYASNNCLNPSYTFEEVRSGLMHVFTTQTVDSNKLCVRFNVNSSVNITSPIVRKYETNIIPGFVENLTVDLGDDGIIDWSYPGVLNLIPQVVIFDINFTGYITLKLSSTKAGQLQINNFIKNSSINPIELNNSLFEDCYNCQINITCGGDPITVDGLEFDFYGDWNYTITAWSGDITDSHIIHIKFSRFNVSIIPQSIDYWDIGPNLYSYEQSSVVPYGNEDGDGNPFFAVDKKDWNHSIDIYIRYNESVDSCAVTWFEGINKTSNSTFNVTLTNISQILIQNITQLDKRTNISTWTNISCAAENSTLILPYFCFNSMCTECVLTSDWDVGCDWIE